jgi:excisionase family DNA binding protein
MSVEEVAVEVARRPARARRSQGEELLTMDEVADILRVHRKTVRRLVVRGLLRCTHVGTALRFKRRWVDEYIERSER